jgi:hypothetical protein
MKPIASHLRVSGGRAKQRASSPFAFCCTVLGLFLLVCSGGCASKEIRPYPYFERLEIVALGGGEEAPDPQTTGEMTGKGLAVGAAGGAATAAVVSLGCGPLFALCFGLTATTFTTVSAVGGAVYGLSGLSREHAEQVGQQFDKLLRARNPNTELAAAVSALLPPRRLAPAEAADARLALELQRLRFLQERNEEFAYSLTFAAELVWELDKKSPRSTSRSLSCETPVFPIQVWLTGNGRIIEREFVRCIEDIAWQINLALWGSSL